MKLLSQEITQSRGDKRELEKKLEETRTSFKNQIEALKRKYLFHSIIWHIGNAKQKVKENQESVHNKKLKELADLQDRPLFNVKNTVKILVENLRPPQYVLDVLSMGPKASLLENFQAKDILVEVDKLQKEGQNRSIPDQMIHNINMKTLQYIKKCEKMKPNRHIKMTQKYLKNNRLVAVPYDKGIGICVMTQEMYQEKLDVILDLPQFEKIEPERTNAKNPILKEEERVTLFLKELKDKELIGKIGYMKMKPTGSKPPRLYGLAKVHKSGVPVRPVLSLPGSAYYNINKFLCQYLARVPECNINTSTEMISRKIKSLELEEDEELISLDVSSLYTNVPVKESIQVCADLLYRKDAKHGSPTFSKEVFIELATMASCDVIMLTHKGYFKQIEGLAMGSPIAPYLANAWLNQFDNIIALMPSEVDEEEHAEMHTSKKPYKCEHCTAAFSSTNHDAVHSDKVPNTNGSSSEETNVSEKNSIIHSGENPYKFDNGSSKENSHQCELCKGRRMTRSQTKLLKEEISKSTASFLTSRPKKRAKFYERYMDDIITVIKKSYIPTKMEEVNGLHRNLTFTKESEEEGTLPFLDMLLIHAGKKIYSTWYTKETDTGLMMNYHALAPNKYKRGMIIGMIHRIYRACSHWNYITESINKAKLMLKSNQYPDEYVEDIIAKTLSKIVAKEEKKEEEKDKEKDEVYFFINYRGKATEEFVKSLKTICASKDSPAFKVPLKVIYTTRQLKTFLPSLKPAVEKNLKSCVIYQLDCPICKNCYVGQTARHVVTRSREHINNEGPVKSHLEKCNIVLKEDEEKSLFINENVKVLMQCTKEEKLLTYEALFIKEIKPLINTREEIKSRKLHIKWVVDSLYGRGDNPVA